MRKMIAALWAYRYFIVSSIKTEFAVRFARSKLGALWMVLHPLAQVIIYALVLSQVVSAKLPVTNMPYAYPLYLLSGMLAWTLFFDIFQKMLRVFIVNGNLLKKLAFPKLALPLIAVGVSLIHYGIFLAVTLAVFGILGHIPYREIGWLVALSFLTVMLATGWGAVLGTLNVFMRDIGQMTEMVLPFLFWLTPVVYTADMIPEAYRWLVWFNPMSAIVEAFHHVLVYGTAPDGKLLWYASVWSIVGVGAGITLFYKAKDDMADVL